MKILVCEDDEVVLKVIQVALENKAVQVVYVRDGRKALDHLNKDHDFDLIITDIHMPYHNGDEILRVLRQDLKKNTPLIMISSDTDEDVIALALKSGVNEFVEKPIDVDKLNKTLKKFIK